MTYSMTLSSVGNPDHGQYCGEGKLSTTEQITKETVEELQLAARAYIERNDLGGGNWASPIVCKGEKEIGHISYNGRFWPKESSDD